jgi:hypothetical protein
LANIPRSAVGASRSLPGLRQGQAQSFEYAARLLRHLADDLGDPLAERDPASLGERLRRVRAPVIARHVLGALARQSADKLALILEVVPAIMKLNAVTVTRQRDIGGVAVHAGSGEDMRLVHGHALCLVDRGGIAVIDMGIILDIEGDGAAVVRPHGDLLRVHLLDGAERAVLHVQAALVL